AGPAHLLQAGWVPESFRCESGFARWAALWHYAPAAVSADWAWRAGVSRCARVRGVVTRGRERVADTQRCELWRDAKGCEFVSWARYADRAGVSGEWVRGTWGACVLPVPWQDVLRSPQTP